MLRISMSEPQGESIQLRLDGRISGRWVKLLRRTCAVQQRRGLRTLLDLRNVSYADRDGIALLQALTEQGVEILHAPPFIAELIRREGP